MVPVHRSDGPNVVSEKRPAERRVDVEWDVEAGERFSVGIRVYGEDRTSLLADIAQSISQTGTNIKMADIGAAEHAAAGVFQVEVRDVAHLDEVIKAVRRVKGVTRVERERPSNSGSERARRKK